MLEEFLLILTSFTSVYFIFVPSLLLYKLVQVVSTVSHCFGHILHE